MTPNRRRVNPSPGREPGQAARSSTSWRRRGGLPSGPGREPDLAPKSGPILFDGTVSRGGWTLEATGVEITAGVTAVVGANGAGKTTLGRAVAGLEALDSGRIVIGGQTVDEPARGRFVPAAERDVGVVFADQRLFGHLRAVDNVAFGLRRQGASRREARHRAAELLELVGLTPGLVAARPAALSGGQRQRVAIARALAPGPEVLILDEPLASVDEIGRGELRSTLTGPGPIHTLLITHDPVDLRTMADRVLVLDEGRVAGHGRPDEIAGTVTSRWAAAFLGANVVAGTGRGTEVATESGFSLTVAAPARGQVHLVFPAHAVALHPDRPAGSARNTWPATVARIDHDGERARVALQGPIDVRADITAGAVDGLGLRPGSQVWASLKATEITVVA